MILVLTLIIIIDITRSPRTTSFYFPVVTVNDEHAKSWLKRKPKG